ncbi:MAG: fibronectin type III domain-containing protein, partial [Candidatus Nanopelagicales bacterium]
TNVKASGIQADPSTVTVTWNEPIVTPGSEVIGYTVSAAPGGMTCYSVTTSCTFENDNALQANLWYTFSVTATNAFGTGPSSLSSISYLVGDAPGQPMNLIATAGLGNVALSWDPVSGPVNAYQVYVSTTDTGPWTVVTLDTGTLNPNYNVSGLTNGTEYWFQVVAVNDSGPSVATTSEGVTPGGAPSAPRHVKITSSTSTTMTIAWMAPVQLNGGPVTQYTVTAFPSWQTCTTATLTCTVTGLEPGVDYDVWVDAQNDFGTSTAAELDAQASAGTAPSNITGVTATPAGLGMVRLSWAEATAAGSVPTTFKVRYRGEVVCSTIETQCTAYRVARATATFSVQGVNVYGASEWTSGSTSGVETVRMNVRNRYKKPKVTVTTAASNQASKIVQRIKRGGKVVKKTYRVSSGAGSTFTRSIVIRRGKNQVFVTSGGFKTASSVWTR